MTDLWDRIQQLITFDDVGTEGIDALYIRRILNEEGQCVGKLSTNLKVLCLRVLVKTGGDGCGYASDWKEFFWAKTADMVFSKVEISPDVWTDQKGEPFLPEVGDSFTLVFSPDELGCRVSGCFSFADESKVIQIEADCTRCDPYGDKEFF